MQQSPLTLAHVTHEAVEQIGGIGAVLEGLAISPVYQQHVNRTILVGPTSTQMTVDPQQRLGEHGQVLYSSIDQIDELGLGSRLRPVEWAFNVAIVYGKREYHRAAEGRSGEAEVLLIDVFRANADRLNVFKLRLWETFGIDSSRYDPSWEYEEYVRLAEPAFYGLRALLDEDDLPCVLFSHEFMGMPAALAAILDGQDEFRTVFHGHECATARRIVEDQPGHDTMFYSVLDHALSHGLYVDEVFGDQHHQGRHALVSRAHVCDGVIAVGDRTRDELRFLNPALNEHPIDLVYNGLPALDLDLATKLRHRQMLLDYSTHLLGYEPDVLMTHLTRPVVSKGLWRDLRVCHELDARFAAEGRTGVLYILTTAGGAKRTRDVHAMEAKYGWPRQHRIGYPDLVGPEIELGEHIDAFNAEHKAVQVVLVNQFGWTRARISRYLSADASTESLRIATDLEFGMATYEPFGISPLEPLGAGALCVISNVCGCHGFVNHVTGGMGSPNVIVADFTYSNGGAGLDAKLAIGYDQRDGIESRVAAEVADRICRRLPRTDADRESLIRAGGELVAKMGWDQVVTDGLLPMLRRITQNGGA